MSTGQFNKQRIQQLEKLVEIEYEKLHGFEEAIVMSDAPSQKIALKQQLKREVLPSLRKHEQDYARLLAAATPEANIPNVEAQRIVAELQGAIQNTQANATAGPAEILERLLEIQEKLNHPGKSAAAKLKVTLPIIPVIVSHLLELNTENCLIGVWHKVRGLFTRALDDNPQTTAGSSNHCGPSEGMSPEAPGAAGLNRMAIHNLPFASIGGLLRGRDRELEELTDGGGVMAITQAIQSLGGVGKTRLAIELGWNAVRDGLHAAVLFVTATSPEALQANLARLAEVLGLAERDTTDQAAQARAVVGWLESRADWLLILDNVDSDAAADAVRELLPRLHLGRVLITSRLHDWGGSINSVELHVLELDEATRFLLDRTQRRTPIAQDKADARRLAGLLGGLPLALEQAAAYLVARQETFADYLRNWERDRARVLEWANPFDKSLVPVAIVWQRTYDTLSLEARAVMRLTALLAPEPIPLTLIEKRERSTANAVELLGKEEEAKPAETEPRDEPDAGEAIGELAKYSLIEREETTFNAHRLVRVVVGMSIPAEQRKAWIECALAWVNDHAPTESDDVRTWGVWNPLAPHAEAIAERADEAGIPEPTARLMSCLFIFFKAKGTYARAERWGRRALEITEAALGPDHPNVAIHVNNLATWLQDTNRLGEAEPLMRRVVTIFENSFGDNHPNVATALNNLAQVLQDTNRLGEAEPLMRRALAIDEAASGPEHPNVAIRLNNLAQLLQATNRPGEAEPLMRRVVTIFENSCGDNHPNVATALNSLAQLLQATNRLGEAEPLMYRALTIDEAALGPDHPKVAIDLNNLATLLKATNRPGEAEPLMRRALAIDEATFGPEHPNVARNLNNLATLLKATNRPGEAEPLMRRALAIDEATFGPEHPNVARNLNNLATLLKATNRPGEAEPLMRRALEIDEAAYGPNHPTVAGRINNLTQLLKETNRMEEAEPLMRRAVEIKEAAYGPNHPTVGISLNNLALLLWGTNRLEEAEPMMRRALEITETSYGPDHPEVAINLVNLAMIEQEKGQGEKALGMLQRALTIFRASYGHDHPYVREILRRLAMADDA